MMGMADGTGIVEDPKFCCCGLIDGSTMRPSIGSGLPPLIDGLALNGSTVFAHVFIFSWFRPMMGMADGICGGKQDGGLAHGSWRGDGGMADGVWLWSWCRWSSFKGIGKDSACDSCGVHARGSVIMMGRAAP